MDEGWAALIGAVVGGTLTVGGQLLIERRRAAESGRSLAIAVAAEAAAVARVVRARGWVEGLAHNIAQANAGVVEPYIVHLPDEFLRAARASVTQAGQLPGAFPGLVGELVVLGDGVASDIRRLANHPLDGQDSLLCSADPEAAAMVFGELSAMLCLGLQACDAIVAEARMHFPEQAQSISSAGPSEAERRVLDDLAAHLFEIDTKHWRRQVLPG